MELLFITISILFIFASILKFVAWQRLVKQDLLFLTDTEFAKKHPTVYKSIKYHENKSN